jgi:hypothetical protein
MIRTGSGVCVTAADGKMWYGYVAFTIGDYLAVCPTPSAFPDYVMNVPAEAVTERAITYDTITCAVSMCEAVHSRLQYLVSRFAGEKAQPLPEKYSDVTERILESLTATNISALADLSYWVDQFNDKHDQLQGVPDTQLTEEDINRLLGGDTP